MAENQNKDITVITYERPSFSEYELEKNRTKLRNLYLDQDLIKGVLWQKIKIKILR